MTRRTRALGLAAFGLILAGCGSTQAAAPRSATVAPPAGSTAPADATSGMSMPSGSSSASSGSAGVQPTKTALMVCGDDISGQIQQVLKLKAPAKTTSTFADELYTCTYQLPVGPLTLSVKHSATDAVAGQFFSAERAKLSGAADLIGLGERAYGTPT